MRFVIRILAYSDGSPCPYAGQFVERFEFDGHDGLGCGWFTTQTEDAKKFDLKSDALEFVGTQSKSHPLRADGKPNRPLNGHMVCVEPVPGLTTQ